MISAFDLIVSASIYLAPVIICVLGASTCARKMSGASGSSAAGVTAPPTVHHQFRLLKAYTAASLSASAIAVFNCLRRLSSQGQVISAQTAPTITTSAST